MKRFSAFLLVAGLLVSAGGSGLEPVAAQVIKKNVPVFKVALEETESCAFRMTTQWLRVDADQVIAMWYFDDTFLLTSLVTYQGSNRAFSDVGPLAATSESHSFKVLVQYYSGGAFVAQVWTDALVVPCGVGGGTGG